MDQTGRIIIFSIIAVILIASKWVFKYFQSKKAAKINEDDSVSNIIKQPKLYLGVGIVGVVVFTAGGILAFLTDPEPYYISVFPMVLLSIAIIFVAALWKIEIKDDEFTFRNMWGIKRTYKYNEVTVRQLERSTRFYRRGKHIVGISYLQDNWDGLQKAIKKYQKNREKQK